VKDTGDRERELMELALCVSKVSIENRQRSERWKPNE